VFAEPLREAHYTLTDAQPISVWTINNPEYRLVPIILPGRAVSVKVAFMSTKEPIEVRTDWTEQIFKRHAAARYSIPKTFPVRVDMYDKTGRRQYEFMMREDWRYVVTSHAPEDGTEHWRTKMVRVATPQGTAQLWVHPECTREELTQGIKHAQGVEADALREAEATEGAPDGRVTEGMCYRLVQSGGEPRPREFLTDSAPDITPPASQIHDAQPLTEPST
jgi:hypothetical protein